MLKRLERLEVYLTSIDAKLGVIANYCEKLPPDHPVETPPVSNTKPLYRDANYACDRVGISESTLLRCQKRNEIKVAKRGKNSKKYFLDEDVETLRKSYWEGEE